MMHLYEIKDTHSDHYWEVYKDDPIVAWEDTYVESFRDDEFVSYNANLMSQGVDFVVHFYDEPIEDHYLVLENA